MYFMCLVRRVFWLSMNCTEKGILLQVGTCRHVVSPVPVFPLDVITYTCSISLMEAPLELGLGLVSTAYFGRWCNDLSMPWCYCWFNSSPPGQNGRHFAAILSYEFRERKVMYFDYLNHYLNQCWPHSLTHICGARGRWVLNNHC